ALPILPPRCQGPIYYFLVFAFFSLLSVFPARFAPMALEGILSVGVVDFVYLCSFCSPLSHRALTHPVPAPPRGEPSVPASITAKFMVRQSRKKVHLTTKFSSVHGRKLGSPCGRAGAKRLRGEAPTFTGELASRPQGRRD